MSQQLTLTIVLYDIPHDRTRTKVSEKCLDYGLQRFQYSAFHGHLTKNRREELASVLEELIEVHGGAITLVPICQTDAAERLDIAVQPPPIERVPLKIHREGEGTDD
jgi:CRISPR-associated protein Cas2